MALKLNLLSESKWTGHIIEIGLLNEPYCTILTQYVFNPWQCREHSRSKGMVKLKRRKLRFQWKQTSERVLDIPFDGYCWWVGWLSRESLGWQRRVLALWRNLLQATAVFSFQRCQCQLPGFVNTRVSIDNWSFKFYYKYTTSLLLLFSAATTARWIF